MADKDVLADVTLDTLKGGAAIELWNYEFAKVLDNIADLNTDADAVRRVTLTVDIKPSDDRDAASYNLKAASKLASVKAAGGTMFLGARGPELVAVEYDPKQRDMFDAAAGADVVPLSVVAGGDDDK